MMKIRFLLLGLGLAVATAAPSVHAGPLPANVVVSAYTYLPGDDSYSVVSGETVVTGLSIQPGDSLMFMNRDVNYLAHSFTADALGSNGRPLFDAALGQGMSTLVQGIETLPPGVYGFHCRYHQDVMHGYLRVVDA